MRILHELSSSIMRSYFVCLVISACLLTTSGSNPRPEYSQISSHESLQNVNSFSNKSVICEEAKIRCALRQGCSAALQAYMLDCSNLISGKVTECDDYCKSSLIALTSTEEGKSLVNCECSNDFCQKSKERVIVCGPDVLQATAIGSVIPCSIAYLICLSDTQCSTALSFYETRCARMFRGKSCSFACNNSISILQRQRNAQKLSSCECDGTESFDCQGIRKNMAELCFHQYEEPPREDEIDINSIETLIKNDTTLESGANAILTLNLIRLFIGLVPSIVVRWSPVW